MRELETEPQDTLRQIEESPRAAHEARRRLRGFAGLLSDEGLTKKASLNAFATALDYAARFVTNFLINPLLIAGLGSYLFGAWRVLGSLIGYMSASGGRPTQTLKMTVAYGQASTDYAQKRRSVGSAIVVWLLFLPLLTLIGALLVWYTPSLLKAPAGLTLVLRVTAAVLALNLLVSNFAEVPEAVLRGENLGYKRMGFTTLLIFLQAGVIALALYLHAGIVGVAVAFLFHTILTGAGFLYVVKSYVPWFGIAKPTVAEVRRFTGLSVWFLAWRLVMQLMLASDVVLLGRFDSVEMVTTYATTKFIPDTLISLVAILVGGVSPGLGGIIGSQNLKKAAAIRDEIMILTWLTATAAGGTILMWNRSFVKLWVGAEYYAGPMSTLFIMLMVAQLVMIRNDATLIDLTLSLRNKVIMGALSSVASIGLAAVMMLYFNGGIVGLCLGLMAGRCLLSLGYPLILGRFLKTSLISQCISVLRPLAVTCLIYTVMMIAGDHARAETWPGLVVSVTVTFGAVTALAFWVGLSSDARRVILRRARSAVERGSGD